MYNFQIMLIELLSNGRQYTRYNHKYVDVYFGIPAVPVVCYKLSEIVDDGGPGGI